MPFSLSMNPDGYAPVIFTLHVMSDNHVFEKLEKFLAAVPGITGPFGHSMEENGQWWVKLSIDIENPLAWNVVQELGQVLNYVSVEERLPTVFKPVSPPPYMNGG